MVRGQPKGTTKGVIRPEASLPRTLVATGDTQLIQQHICLIEDYLKNVKRSAWWHQEHSFATVGVYTAFFYRCLGPRVYNQGELSIRDLLGLYKASHGAAVMNSTLVEHCRRLTVLATILHNVGILHDGPVTHSKELQSFFAELLRGSSTVRPSPLDRCNGFNATEVSQMYSSCKNEMEFVLLLLLLTTGIRVGGAVNLRVDGLCDDPGATPCVVRREAETIEKGGVRHRFFVCPVLQHWIQKHIEAHRGSVYFFPSRYRPDEPCSVGHLQCVFRQLCQRARVQGPNNIHRTRHTLAHALRLSGAPAKHIQLILGHTCPRTTDSYGSLCMNELIERMRLPWDGVEQGSDKDQAALLRSLCPPEGYRLPWMGANSSPTLTCIHPPLYTASCAAGKVERISLRNMVELLSAVVGRHTNDASPFE